MPRLSGVALVSSATVLFICLFLCRLAFSTGVDVCQSIVCSFPSRVHGYLSIIS